MFMKDNYHMNMKWIFTYADVINVTRFIHHTGAECSSSAE